MSNDSVFKQPENSPILPKQPPSYDWDQDPEIRRSGDVSAQKPEIFVVPTIDDINRIPDLPSGDDEESDAWSELGGRPSDPSMESKIAMYHAGLGSKQMRAEVHRYLEAQEQADQAKINKIGAEAARKAGLPDRPLSVEEQARLRVAEQRRQERS